VTSARELYGQLGLGPAPSRIGNLRAVDTDVVTASGAAVVAVDDGGTRHLLVPVPEGSSGRPDLGAAVSVRLRVLTDSGTDRLFVDVACTEHRLHDLFDIVVNEMLHAVSADPDGDHRRHCQRVLDRWRQLLRRGSERLLGPEQLAGLAAELVWLTRMARIDPDAVLRIWRGPLGEAHDLRGPGLAVEIKGLTSGTTVEIHGLRQLEPPTGAALFLAAVHLDPPGEGSAVSVPSLVEGLIDSGVDGVELLKLLAEVPYDHADREVYEAFAWTVVGEAIYEIDNGFPHIAPDVLVGGPPVGITAVRYSLDLAVCTPVAIEPEALAIRLADIP
jgi:hypothetical protein